MRDADASRGLRRFEEMALLESPNIGLRISGLSVLLRPRRLVPFRYFNLY